MDFTKELKETDHDMVIYLQYNEVSGSVITPCNKIDKPLMVYRFTGNVMSK